MLFTLRVTLQTVRGVVPLVRRIKLHLTEYRYREEMIEMIGQQYSTTVRCNSRLSERSVATVGHG